MEMPPKFIFTPTLDNYRSVLFGAKTVNVGSYAPSNTHFPRSLLNSMMIGLTSTFLALLLGTPAAYCLSKYNFRFKQDIAFFVLSTRFVPPIAVVIPFFVLFRQAQLLDTRLSLIIMYIFMNLALVIWMLKGFFDEVPTELQESARVDGCTQIGAFVRIALPLAAPGIAAAAILCLLMSWNEFLFAVIFTAKVAKTAPVGVYSFVTFREIVWGSLAAAGIITTIPILIFTLLVQKNLVRGLTAGAIK
jgi:multiple sugar transport system permease protein